MRGSCRVFFTQRTRLPSVRNADREICKFVANIYVGVFAAVQSSLSEELSELIEPWNFLHAKLSFVNLRTAIL
jgi:Na+/H+ antiporter NhaD/arsenite permease-like protein